MTIAGSRSVESTIISGEVIPGFNLLAARDFGPQHFRQILLGALNQAFRPARLLRLEGGHLDGQLSRTFDVLQIAKLPAR
jgi:hypothetical protein